MVSIPHGCLLDLFFPNQLTVRLTDGMLFYFPNGGNFYVMLLPSIPHNLFLDCFFPNQLTVKQTIGMLLSFPNGGNFYVIQTRGRS